MLGEQELKVGEVDRYVHWKTAKKRKEKSRE